MYLSLCHQIEFFSFILIIKYQFGDIPHYLYSFIHYNDMDDITGLEDRVYVYISIINLFIFTVLYFAYYLFMNYASMFMREIMVFPEMQGFWSCQQLRHDMHHSLPACPFLWSQHSIRQCWCLDCNTCEFQQSSGHTVKLFILYLKIVT